MNKKYYLFVIIIIIALLVFLVLVRSGQDNNNKVERDVAKTMTTNPTRLSPFATLSALPSPSPISTSEPATTPDSVVEPIDEFEKRITKKEFGQYITPQNSPIENERFSGYHTGTDVEYEDNDSQVEVRSIADGEVTYSSYVNGYGGVVIISHDIAGQSVSSLYGHLDPENLLPVGENIKKNQTIGHLGEEGNETDGERKHLHIGIYNGHSTELRGYVQSESELSKWMDPVVFIKNN